MNRFANIFLLNFISFSCNKGNREAYPYPANRRSGGYAGEDEGYSAGRSRDAYVGPQESQQNYAREEKQVQRYRDHQGNKNDPDEFDEHGRRKNRSSRDRKGILDDFFRVLMAFQFYDVF